MSHLQPAPDHTPKDPAALHRWLVSECDIHVARLPLLGDSAAPFDYIAHAFFEGRIPKAEPLPSADCIVWANRGGGKTFLGAVATMLDLIFKPGIEVRIIGGSLEQSSRMFDHLRALFERDNLKDLLDGRATEKQIRLKNGSRAQVLAQSQTAIRGTRVQKIRCDEVELFDREVWEAAQLATRSLRCKGPWGDWIRGSIEALSTMHRPFGLMYEIVGDAQIGAKTTSPVPQKSSGSDDDLSAPATSTDTDFPAPRRPQLFRWGVADVLEHCPPERRCQTCPLHPECQGRAKTRTPDDAGHIAIDDAIAMKSRVSKAVWETEMLCLRPRRDHSVFPEFDPDIHVFAHDDQPITPQDAAPVNGQTLVCGMDFGFRNPTAILWARLDERDGQKTLRILDERVVAEARLGDHIDAIAAHALGEPKFVAVDPAGLQVSGHSAKSSVQALRERSFAVMIPPNSVHLGLNLIRARIAPALMQPHAPSPPAGPADDAPPPFPITAGPRLFIHRRCKKLIESLIRYHYDPDDLRSLTPVKNGPDHAIDALRYLIAALDNPRKTTRTDYLHGGVR